MVSFWFITHLFYFYLSDQPIERTLQTPITLHSINRSVNATLTRLIILPSYAQCVHRADSAPSLDRMLQLRTTSAAIARSARSPSRTLSSDQKTSLGTLLQLPRTLTKQGRAVQYQRFCPPIFNSQSQRSNTQLHSRALFFFLLPGFSHSTSPTHHH